MRTIYEIFSNKFGHIEAIWNDDNSFTVCQEYRDEVKTWDYTSRKLALSKVKSLCPLSREEAEEARANSQAFKMERHAEYLNELFYESVY